MSRLLYPWAIGPCLRIKLYWKFLLTSRYVLPRKGTAPKPPPARSVPAGQGQSRLWTVPFRYTSTSMEARNFQYLRGSGLRQTKLFGQSFFLLLYDNWAPKNFQYLRGSGLRQDNCLMRFWVLGIGWSCRLVRRRLLWRGWLFYCWRILRRGR